MIDIKEEVLLYQELRFERYKRIKEDISNFSKNDLEKLLLQLKDIKKDDLEPDDLDSILKLCDQIEFDDNNVITNFDDKLKGAIIGRFVGCLLGVPVEGYSIEYMEELAKKTNTPFPPTEFWHKSDKPNDWIQYGIDLRANYTLDKMDAFLVDDDINFVYLNLLLMKLKGTKYSINDVASIWKKYLPIACTAEDRALEALKNNVDPLLAAEDNPFIEWIGAAIRADAFGYVFAGDPKKAALASYNDAYLTHRRNGIYGEMFLASAIAAAFKANSPIEALKIGMSYVPKTSRLYKDLKWAFDNLDSVTNFKDARKLIDERFIGMNSVHTINNMCAIVFISALAKDDYTKAISYAVALGLDNDCTAASIGSLFGACYGLNSIDPKWYKNLGNKVHLFINGKKETTIEELVQMVKDIKERENII